MLNFRTATEKADLITEYIAVPHGKRPSGDKSITCRPMTSVS